MSTAYIVDVEWRVVFRAVIDRHAASMAGRDRRAVPCRAASRRLPVRLTLTYHVERAMKVARRQTETVPDVSTQCRVPSEPRESILGTLMASVDSRTCRLAY